MFACKYAWIDELINVWRMDVDGQMDRWMDE